MKYSKNDKRLQKQSMINSSNLGNLLSVNSRPVIQINQIPRSTENTHTVNSWIKSDADLPQTIIEPRPTNRNHSSRTLTSTIPQVSIHEMIIGLYYFYSLHSKSFFFV